MSKGGPALFRHILVPTDGSRLSSAAVDKAIAFARDAGARITVLTVVEPLHGSSAAPDHQLAYSAGARHRKPYPAHILAEAEHKARLVGVEVATLQVGSDFPHEAIVATATARGCDLIAMASHGRGGLAAVVIGSQTAKVLAHSKIPVLVYR